MRKSISTLVVKLAKKVKGKFEFSVYQVNGKGVVTVGNDKQIVQVKKTIKEAMAWAFDNVMVFPIYLECF